MEDDASQSEARAEFARLIQDIDRGASGADLLLWAFRLLECDLRGAALVALEDWICTWGANERVFLAAARLQRPSWGHYQGLLDQLVRALREARKSREASARTADGPLLRWMEFRGGAVEGVTADEIDALARHVEADGGTKGLSLLALCVRARNHLVHGHPNEAWARACVGLLRPVLVHFRASPLAERVRGDAPWPTPWFQVRDGRVAAFCGFDEKSERARFVGIDGASYEDPDAGGEILKRLETLSGQHAASKERFRSRLRSLVPETHKGVFMGDYLLGRPLGQGGHSVVHAGVQLSTGREVAVKLLWNSSPDLLRRFRREAEILGKNLHPHVLAVYAAGTAAWWEPQPGTPEDPSEEGWFKDFKSRKQYDYIAMERLDERSLGHRLAEARARHPVAPVDTLVEWFRQAAEALAAVHTQGVVHRDLKPSNLLLTRRWTEHDLPPRLKVTDFGIAQFTALDRTQTRAPTLGTEAYASPEQLTARTGASSGDSLRVESSDGAPNVSVVEGMRLPETEGATDVYSLCQTFFELFTGTRLYDHDREPHEALRRKLDPHALPPDPRSIAGAVPRDVAVLIRAGLAYRAEERPTMRSLADNLARVQRGEAIGWRDVPLWWRAWLAVRRNRAVSFLIAALAVATGVYLMRLQNARDEATRASAEALARSAAALAGQPGREVDATFAAIRAVGHEVWSDLAEGPPRAALDGILGATRALARSFPLPRSHSQLVALRVTPTGERVLTVSLDGVLAVWDHRAMRFVRRGEARALVAPTAHASQAALSNDGERVAVGYDDGEVAIWTPGVAPRRLTGPHRSPISTIVFSADGKRMVTGAWDATLCLWDLTGDRCVPLVGHTRRIVQVLLRPSDAGPSEALPWSIASASEDCSVILWDREGRYLSRLVGHTTLARRLRSDASGRFLLSTGTERILHLWDTHAHAPTVDLIDLTGFDHEVHTSAFRLDSGRIDVVAASFRRQLLSWHVEDCLRLSPDADGVRHCSPVTAHALPSGEGNVAMSSDGERFAVATFDRGIEIWDTRRETLLETLHGHSARIDLISFARGHDSLVSADVEDTVRAWFAPFPEVTRPTLRRGIRPLVRALAPSIDEDVLAAAYEDGVAEVFGDHDRSPCHVAARAEPVLAVGWRAGGRELVLVSQRGLRTVGVTTCRETTAFAPFEATVEMAAFSANGERVFTVDASRGGWIRDARDAHRIAEVTDVPRDLLAVSLAPDGRTLATGTASGAIAVGTQERDRLPLRAVRTAAMEGVSALVFDPAGEALLAGGDRGSLWVARRPPDGAWAIETLDTRLTGDVTDAVFTRDGALAAVADSIGNVTVFERTLGAPLLTFPGSAGHTALAFTSRAHLAVAYSDGAMNVFPTNPQELLRAACALACPQTTAPRLESADVRRICERLARGDASLRLLCGTPEDSQ